MATHSVSAFEVTVKNGAIKGNDKSAVLGAIHVKAKAQDLLDVIREFANGKAGKFKKVMVNDANRLVTIWGVQSKDGTRDISFYVRQGTFGMPGDIIDSDTSATAYKKRSKDSDIFNYYVQFRIPKGSKVGLAILHSIGNVGVKSWLAESLGEHVNNKLSGCALRIRPLCSKIALKTYLKDAEVRSIRVSNYEPVEAGDVASYLNDPLVEKDLILKRDGGFGSLLSLMNAGKKRDKLIAISDDNCTDVKADVTFGGRSRTISLEGSKIPKAKFYLIEDDVNFNDGLPTRQSISIFATTLLDDLMVEVKAGN